MKKLLLVTLVMAGALMAQPPGGRGPGRRGFGPPPEGGVTRSAKLTALKETLGLTDDQVEKLRAAQKSQREAAAPLMKQMGEKQRALRQAMSDGSTPQTGSAQLAEIEALRKQIATAQATARTQAAGLLTPAQQQKLAALQEAAKLMPSVHEAAMLGLVERPAGGPRW